MKKLYFLASILAIQAVSAQKKEDFTFSEVQNHGLPAFSQGSAVMGKIGEKKALLITGLVEFKPTTAIYYLEGKHFVKSNDSFQGVKNGQAIFVDIDNDGDQDVALIGHETKGNTFARHFKIYANENGVFNLKKDYAGEGLGFSSIDAGDYDGDGDQDLVVTGQLSSDKYGNVVRRTAIYKNDGQGDFTRLGVNFYNVEQGTAKFIDINNDKKPDLVIAGLRNRYGTVVTYIQNNGNFKIGDDFTNDDFGFEGVDIVTGDVNRDGFTDFITLGKGYQESNMIFLNEEGEEEKSKAANRQFQPSENVFDNYDSNMSKNTILWEDLNGDGRRDVVFVGQRPNQQPRLDIWKGTADGFEKSNYSSVANFGLHGSVVAFDFDDDGDLDLFASGEDANGDPVSMLLENKKITLSTNEVALASDVVVYPNPVVNSFVIKGIDKITHVDIYDMSGKLVNSFASQNEYNISNLPKGNYVVSVKGSISKRFRIIKK